MISRTPRVTLIPCFTSSGIDFLKNKEVLLLFIFCPDASSYTFSMSINLLHSSIVALQKIRLSSTKSRCVSFGPFLQRNYPWMSPCKFAFLIKPFSPSVQRRNRKGESGSPYLIPLLGKIIPHGSPFTKIEYETVFTQPIARFIHLSLKPIFLIIPSK